jgi:3-oxoacyl-[acyl-carrier protein] reductase
LIPKESIFTIKSLHTMVIIITGASRGIGEALAHEVSGSGHTVILISRNRLKLDQVAKSCNEKAGTTLAHTIPFDLTDLSHLEKEFTSMILGITDRVDALVNNAGQMISKPFDQISETEGKGLFDANFFAPARLISICLPLMKGSKLKHIVNITSMAGFQGSGKFTGLSYYSASKAALGSLTECLAEELKEDGYKINALAIGAVQTEMLAEAFPGFKALLDPPQMAEYIGWFLLEGGRYFNGKILPVSLATP